MSELWRGLRVGDHVRIKHMPGEFSEKGYHLHEETRRLYEHLISERKVLSVERIDEQGLPWIEYTWVGQDGADEFHSLAINHHGLERAV